MELEGGSVPVFGGIPPDFDIVESLTGKVELNLTPEERSNTTDSEQGPSDSNSTQGDNGDSSNRERPTKPERRPSLSRKRSRSTSRSDTEANSTKVDTNAKTRAYTSPSDIAKIFRNMITTDALCQLSAMEDGTPADVKKIIPRATVDQICKMCDLWEKARKPKRGKSKHTKRDRRRSFKRRRTKKQKNRSEKTTDKESGREKKKKMSAFPVPTPKKSDWTKRLRVLVKNAGVDKGNEVNLSSDSDSSSESSSSDSNRKKEILSNEKIFKKLLNNPAERTNLASIHAARSHKYGHTQFGPKKWYRASENISRKLTAQEDRRKFRQGLKCNVDFLNQLNMHD